ncbi:MAG TPA: hypothetical protein VIC27_08760 [Ktedonobacterales bacterium]|jgi:hypothetical protein
MRMTAAAQGAIARRYQIAAEGVPVAEINFPALGPSTASPIAGRTYRLRRVGVLRERLTLEPDAAGARAVASATQRDPLRRDFAVELGDRHLRLRAASPLRSEYLLLDGAQTIGAVRPAGALRHDAEADLPDDLPLEARIFILWVVLLLWRRRRITA